jgi:hypothetical protein
VAVVLAFRLALVLGPASVVVVRWAQGPGPANLPGWLTAILSDPDEDDETKTAAVASWSGRVSEVTTFGDPFELRKLQVLFGRSSGAATPEDDAVITFHLLKLAAGVPSADWTVQNFVDVETAFDTFWNAIKNTQSVNLRLKQLRWYATGPQIDIALGAPGRTGPPRRVVERNLPGTSPFSPPVAMPPQVAISVTEKTAVASAWGRFYLPAPLATSAVWTGAGRLDPAYQTTLGNAADAFYEACRTAGLPVVVYSAAKPERETKAGLTLPAVAARALTVDQLQVDDLADVIRSRRWNAPLLRLQRDVAA